MKYFVYLLISKTNNKIVSYVGFTSNVKNRIKLHNTSKGAKFTRGRRWILAYKKCYKSKSLALKNEYLLKKNYKKRSEIKNKFLNSLMIVSFQFGLEKIADAFQNRAEELFNSSKN